MGQTASRWKSISNGFSDAMEAGPETDRLLEQVCSDFGIDVRRFSPVASASVDLALHILDVIAPGWVIDHLGDEASGYPPAMKALGATCELTNGKTEVQGQAATRSLAILAAVFLTKDTETPDASPRLVAVQ